MGFEEPRRIAIKAVPSRCSGPVHEWVVWREPAVNYAKPNIADWPHIYAGPRVSRKVKTLFIFSTAPTSSSHIRWPKRVAKVNVIGYCSSYLGKSRLSTPLVV